MWKYILIIAFVLFAIREINLMNESLYVAPDTHEIVAKDKTVIGKVVKVVEKIEEIKTRKSKKTDTAAEKPQQARQTEEVVEKSSETAPSLSHFEEQNNSAKDVESLPEPLPSEPTLQQIEKEAQHITPKPSIPSHMPTKTKELYAPVTAKPQPPKQEEPAPPPAIHKQIPKQTSFPDAYQRAQEKVNAILEQMRRGD